jgi:hypothetical protein
VTYRDPETGERKVFGWSSTMEGAESMMASIHLHPSMGSPSIRDREPAPVARETLDRG